MGSTATRRSQSGVGLAASAWSMEIVVKIMPWDTNFPCLVGDGHTTTSDNGVTICSNNNNTIPSQYGVAIRISGTEYSTFPLTGATLQGAPVHIVVTYDGSHLRWYVNGYNWQAVSASGSYANNGSNPINIGRNPSYSSSNLGGFYDAFAIYDSALSASRILAHYLALGPRSIWEGVRCHPALP